MDLLFTRSVASFHFSYSYLNLETSSKSRVVSLEDADEPFI